MSHSLTVGGRTLAVRLKRSSLARRMSLRLDPAGDAVVVVLPPRAADARALQFAASLTDWIAVRLAQRPAQVPFEDGTVLPLLGCDHVVRHRPAARRGVWAEDGEINVSGRPEHLPRRLEDWLREQARAETLRRVQLHAGALGRAVGRITVKDTRSRWGSCSSKGDIAFSWRLVLAPEAVLDYVVAHEVAHLAEMNHSPAFWRLVEQLVPGYGPARAWLKRHGAQLHRYG